MELIHTTRNVKYLPLPNRVDFIASQIMTSIHLTKTSFVIPFVDSENVILANNVRRGYEIPGGHVEPNEMLIEAAQRECLEETGYEINNLIPIGFLRMTSEGDPPPEWKYPHPISYQQFFAGEVDHSNLFVPNDECFDPVILNMKDLSILNSQQQMLINIAHKNIYMENDHDII